MNTVIVEGLGKRYMIASKRPATEPRRTVNLGFTRAALPQWRLLGRAGAARELWALRNVSFQVASGTILGIVGPNGAGKSTLLKIIARVTRPTEGRVIGYGRVVSLLELGAGFNPDFSARENILMNAAMHGVPRREVLEQMDEIIQFAEIEQFADTPLRHYSSGMYLRLAFSVAINMRPGLLLADEILAVGDLAFQERCLERVAVEAKRGLTVLFVSHDMAALARLCDRVIWLDKGELVLEGVPDVVIPKYQEAALRGTRHPGDRYGEPQGRHANVVVEIASVSLLNAARERIGAAPTTEDVYIRIRTKVRKRGAELRAEVDVQAKGMVLFRAVQPETYVVDHLGVFDLLVRIPAYLLAETTYTVGATVHSYMGKEAKVVLPSALSFLAYGDDPAALPKNARSGVIAPRLDWHVESHVNARKKKREKQPKSVAG
jgi:ABC-type polysaccharide/polyol phosphate transport system ATPase subunit